MKRPRLVNEFVRKRLKKFRTLLGLSQREVAARARLPVSSYACLEAGHYEFRLDILFRVVAGLGLDIFDVWPPESYLGTHPEVRKGEVSYDSLYLKRIQEFRINEIVLFSSAEGAALFELQDSRCELLLHAYLSETFLQRLRLYLLVDEALAGGLTFSRTFGNRRLVFFLKARSCPAHLEQLIGKYLTIWSALF